MWGQLPSNKYNVIVKKIVAEKPASVWQSGLEAGDKIIEINGSNISSPYGLIAFAKMSAKFDGKASLDYINENLEKLSIENPKLKTNEIIPKDTLVKLPQVGTEKPILLNKDQLMGVEKIKDEETKLSETQIKLRNELEGKNSYLSDGNTTLEDIAYAISDNAHPINITVERNGERITLKPIYSSEKGLIGIEQDPQEIMIQTKDLKSIIKGSSQYLYNNTYLLLYGLKQIFTGKIPLNDLHGVILITKLGGDTIQNEGIFPGLLLTALISLDLAIVNFLPIPALDGGHVMFLLIEKIRGRKLEEEIIEKIGTAGFMFLILLMVFVIFNDIYALITNKF